MHSQKVTEKKREDFEEDGKIDLDVEFDLELNGGCIPSLIFFEKYNKIVLCSRDKQISVINLENGKLESPIGGEEPIFLGYNTFFESLVKWNDDVFVATSHYADSHFSYSELSQFDLFQDVKFRRKSIMTYPNLFITSAAKLGVDVIGCAVTVDIGKNKIIIVNIRKGNFYVISVDGIVPQTNLIPSMEFKDCIYCNCSDKKAGILRRLNYRTKSDEMIYNHHKEEMVTFSLYFPKSKDHEIIVGGGLSRILYFYDSFNGHCLKEVSMKVIPQSSSIFAEFLLFGDFSGNVALFNLKEMKHLKSWRLHEDSILDMKVMKGGGGEINVATGSKDMKLRVSRISNLKFSNVIVQKKQHQQDLGERVKFVRKFKYMIFKGRIGMKNIKIQLFNMKIIDISKLFFY